MTRPPKNTRKRRDYGTQVRKPSAARGPNFLAHEANTEFVPEIRLIKASDLKPKETHP